MEHNQPQPVESVLKMVFKKLYGLWTQTRKGNQSGTRVPHGIIRGRHRKGFRIQSREHGLTQFLSLLFGDPAHARMGSKKLAFCFSQVCSKEDRRDPSLVPAQGECKIMIPPEGSWGVETVSARIIKMDPAGGDLVYRIV